MSADLPADPTVADPVVAHVGRCACGGVRFRVLGDPMIVHCCHCADCRRETGTAFALNAMWERDRLTIDAGAPERVAIPSASGRGQAVLRCPDCRVALWSHYAGGGGGVAFVRIGTLEDAALFAPDIHIYTRSKLPWVAILAGARAVPEYYDAREIWPAASRERYRAARSG